VAKSAPETFISYSRKDSEFALKLAKKLRAGGVSVWLDKLNIIPGQAWDLAIQGAIENNPFMLVILSPAAIESQDVRNEFNYALALHKTVIPVLYRECKVPFRLQGRQWADFRGEYQNGFEELLKALRSEGTKASTTAILQVEKETPTAVPARTKPKADRLTRPPSRGTPALFVTLHGGRDWGSRDNVRAYGEDGKLITRSVLSESAGVLLDALRSVHLFGNYLYVVNANKLQNSVLCYKRTKAGYQYRFAGWFASRHTCNAILKPFDLAFDDFGYCYLSSQYTNVVTRFIVSDGGKTATPAPTAGALPTNGKFLPGTFVASNDGMRSDPPTTPVRTPAGLEYLHSDKILSVRGIAWANGRLYVVDLPASRIKVYDITGKYLGQSNQVDSPRQILIHRENLYVSGGDFILTSRLPTFPGDFVLNAISGVRVKNSCGMAFGKSDHFYVASRTENQILKFDSDFKQVRKFRCYLPDNPEFLCPV